MKGFQLTRLTLIGRSAPTAEVLFNKGLNVISGPSDTGKTFIVQCIDFMLGGSKVPKPIPQSEGYETVELGILRLDDGKEIVLERSLRGGNFRLLEEGKADKPLNAKHQADAEDNISQYLLGLTGLRGRKVRTNKDGKTRELSFRDIARLILIDEETVISERSPIHSGQYINSTVESAVFRLLLTGIDDASLIANEDPKTVKGKQEGKAEMLELLLSRTRTRMYELKLSEDKSTWQSHVEQLESLFGETEKALVLDQQAAVKLEEKRRSDFTRFHRIESQKDVLTELQLRFKLLEKQYESDLFRLESIAEASIRLGQMSEGRCPICGSSAEHQEHGHKKSEAEPEDMAQACLVEAGKIKALLSDLHKTANDNNVKIQDLDAEAIAIKNDLQRANEELQLRLKPRIDISLKQFREHQGQRDIYRRALDLSVREDELQGLLEEIATKKESNGSVLASAKLQTDEVDLFCKEVESLLRAWNFPSLDRVTFSESDQDIVISGRKRASHGKGVRAIAHAAFNLALLNYSLKRAMPHPALVLIDSPLVVYREPDTDEGGFERDVKDAFYRSIANDFGASQVIIIENEDPPLDIEKGANVIRFTGASHGRKGFVPA